MEVFLASRLTSFKIRPYTFTTDTSKINYAVSNLNFSHGECGWHWEKHATKLLLTDVPEPTWDYFVTFLKETISPLKQRVAKIGSQLTQLDSAVDEEVWSAAFRLRVTLEDMLIGLRYKGVSIYFLFCSYRTPYSWPSWFLFVNTLSTFQGGDGPETGCRFWVWTSSMVDDFERLRLRVGLGSLNFLSHRILA